MPPRACANGHPTDQLSAQRYCYGLRPGGGAELANCFLRVLIDGPLGDVQNFSDLLGRFAFRRPPQDLALARAERMICCRRQCRFNELPFAVSPRRSELMSPRHLQHFGDSTRNNWKGAQCRYWLALEHLVDQTFVVAKVVPVLGG